MRAALAAVFLAAYPPNAGAQGGVSLVKSPAEQQHEGLSFLEPGGLRSGYDEAFFWETPDGALRWTFGGLLQYHGDFFEGGLDGPLERDSQFDLRRMRLELGGGFLHRYRFNLEPNFNEAGLELEEAWMGAELGDGPLLILGRMKEPFSMEEMSSRRWQDFANFSILNQLVPAEDHGVTLLQKGSERTLEYGLAVYNGTGGDDLNDDKDVAGRVVVRPWAGSSSCCAGLQLGAAITYGEADQDVSGSGLRTEAKVPFLSFEPGSSLDGRRVRTGAEIAWLRGPFALQAEAMQMRQDMQGAGGDADVDLDAWYVQASWVLTGEERKWSGIQPERSTGAWQIAARVSQLGLDDDLVPAGIVAPGSDPERVESYDLGVNWWVNRHAAVKLHWLHTVYDQEIAIGGGLRSDEDAVLVQFQLQW